MSPGRSGPHGREAVPRTRNPRRGRWSSTAAPGPRSRVRLDELAPELGEGRDCASGTPGVTSGSTSAKPKSSLTATRRPRRSCRPPVATSCGTRGTGTHRLDRRGVVPPSPRASPRRRGRSVPSARVPTASASPEAGLCRHEPVGRLVTDDPAERGRASGSIRHRQCRSASAAMPVATATPEPPLDPPGESGRGPRGCG